MARVLISMPEDFLDKIDQVADGENRTRSELIREALRTYIKRSRIANNTKAKIKYSNCPYSKGWWMVWCPYFRADL